MQEMGSRWGRLSYFGGLILWIHLRSTLCPALLIYTFQMTRRQETWITKFIHSSLELWNIYWHNKCYSIRCNNYCKYTRNKLFSEINKHNSQHVQQGQNITEKRNETSAKRIVPVRKSKKSESKDCAIHNETKFVDRKGLENYLKKLNIPYQVHDHVEVFTVDALMKYVGSMPGLHMKNLFLKDKKKNLYLLSTRHDAEVCYYCWHGIFYLKNFILLFVYLWSKFLVCFSSWILKMSSSWWLTLQLDLCLQYCHCVILLQCLIFVWNTIYGHNIRVLGIIMILKISAVCIYKPSLPFHDKKYFSNK